MNNWEKQFDELWDNCVSWKIGDVNNYKGGDSNCSHDLREEHRKAKRILKSFISKLLKEPTNRKKLK